MMLRIYLSRMILTAYSLYVNMVLCMMARKKQKSTFINQSSLLVLAKYVNVTSFYE
jgi:hypothetical protein